MQPRLNVINAINAMVCIKDKGRIMRHNRMDKTRKRPADILIYSFDNGDDVAVDVGVISVLKASVSVSDKYKKLAAANLYYTQKLNTFNKYLIA